MERSKKCITFNKDYQNIRIIHLNICLGNESKVQGDETSGNDNLLPAIELSDIMFQSALNMHCLPLKVILCLYQPYRIDQDLSTPSCELASSCLREHHYGSADRRLAGLLLAPTLSRSQRRIQARSGQGCLL